jgi:hypothetical protein
MFFSRKKKVKIGNRKKNVQKFWKKNVQKFWKKMKNFEIIILKKKLKSE